MASADADWSDRASVTEYLVAYRRVLVGGRRPFDERFARDVVRRDMERARNFASVQNHDAIPGARLLRLEGAGHGLEPADWETLAAAIPDHTAEG